MGPRGGLQPQAGRVMYGLTMALWLEAQYRGAHSRDTAGHWLSRRGWLDALGGRVPPVMHPPFCPVVL